ncbi:ion channel [Flavimaribacter sediminis]
MFAIGIGVCISLMNIAVHAVFTVVMVRTVRRDAERLSQPNVVFREVLIMIIAAAILMLAHLIEVWIWSLFYRLLGVTPDSSADFDFAFINYTTLGYGRLVPEAPWQVLGPMTAMNGVLLFGWSTAVLFQVLAVSARRFGIRY